MLYDLFNYNWQVRDEWIEWADNLPKDELNKMRTGGYEKYTL